MSQYALYTHFTASPGKGKSLVNVLMKANRICSNADGCRLYIINQEIDNADSIWVTELWDSEEDHSISLALDGCKELVIEAGHLLARAPEQIELKALAGKGVESGVFA